MRPLFDLLTLAGWQEWWYSKFNKWGYVYIIKDTLPHFKCLFIGHHGPIYCVRCHMRIKRTDEVLGGKP